MSKTRVNTTLAILAAMAVAIQAMPESAKAPTMGLAYKPKPTPSKMSRRQRRILASRIRRGEVKLTPEGKAFEP